MSRTAARIALVLAVCAAPAAGEGPQRLSLDVTATAYNSTPAQTDDTPGHGAWGDDLDAAVRPGLRVIAVSHDLAQKGLRRGQRVRIHGLAGEFVVLDRMPRRWRNRIDIYMHKDVRAARKWGRRRVKISWTPES
ncbi:MAG: 3D domain-containing protein [Nevskiaceae bacterium]